MIEHRGVVNLAWAHKELFDLPQCGHVLQFASISFDASVSEIFASLWDGCVLHLLRGHEITEVDLSGIIKGSNIDTLTIPPSLLAVLSPEAIERPCTVITAGEACSVELARKWGKRWRLVNAYGPTETTVCASCYEVPTEFEGSTLPIGKPIANTQIYILDRQGKLCPVGVVGELCIGGAGLARGYLNRPELTAEKFIANPFIPGGRLYRTGDLARWRPDGNLELYWSDGRSSEGARVSD